MSKLTLLTAAAAGYVLGARAGRERYDQIADAARTFAGNPKVQSATHQAQSVVADQASAAKDVATDKAKEAASALADKVRREGGGSHAAAETHPAGTATPGV